MIDVGRSVVPPASLQNETSWSGEDVKEQLWKDFLGKCYLTELPVTVAAISVDHFRPKGHACFKHLTYDWENLFPTDRNANERRPKKWPVGGLLDPSANDHVEERLQQYLDDENVPHFAAADSNDLQAVNTAAQLEHLHNDAHPKAADLRNAITKYFAKVLAKLLELRRAISATSQDSAKIARLEAEVRKLVSRRAPFTTLVRSRVQRIWPHDQYFD